MCHERKWVCNTKKRLKNSVRPVQCIAVTQDTLYLEVSFVHINQCHFSRLI